MAENKSIKQPEEKPILTLIQQIKDGLVSPDTISKDLRRQCMEIFRGEGYSIASMAQIFGKCERTIKRDIDKINDNEKLSPNIELVKKLCGEFVAYARIHRDHLMRLARSKEASIAERAQAELFAFKVFAEMITKLQTLGYLPMKPKEIIGDFSHHIEVEERSFKELKQELKEIETISKECGELTPELKKELVELSCKLDKTELQAKVIAISQKKHNREDTNEKESV